VPKLVITGSDGARREIELTTRDLRIGRAPENDLSLPDPTKGVSRMHAELRYENGRYVIIDLNSQNGTWLDGARVQRADVASGSEIAIGPYRLALVGTGAPESKTTEEVPEIGARTMRLDAPARPASPAPARQGPPPRRPATRPAPAAQAPGPIAALARLPKPLLFGGFFAIALIIIVLGQLFAPSEPATPAGEASGDSPAGPTEPVTNAQIVERNLTEAKALIEKKDYNAAIRDHLDRILLIDPNHAEAADLKMKAQEALRAAQAAAAPADTAASTVPSTSAPAAPAGATTVPPAAGSSPGTTAPAPTTGTAAAPAGRETQPPARGNTGRSTQPVEILPSARRPNETPQQWRARNADLTAQYNAAKGALDRRNFAAAISGLEALVKAEPGYLDAPQLLVRAREESRAGGKEAFDAGTKAEAAGNWTVAIENYERAQKVDPSLGAEDAAKRVRDKMTAAGADAFRRARQFDAVGRSADALKEYANAALWLPDGDANKAVARQRVDQLKAGQK
jgi:pSer/pThr/pTyr-binding forkhead associated (FHA) protein/tetratricopeptide (TPR) repeat protein